MFFELNVTQHIYVGLGIVILLSPLIFKRNTLFIYLILFLSAYLGGLVRFSATLEYSLEQRIFQKQIVAGEELEIIGDVVSEPLQKAKTKQFLVDVSFVNGIQISGVTILVYSDPYEPVQYADRIKFLAEVEYPEEFITETGRTFDYINYLAKDGIRYTTYFPAVKEVSQHEYLSGFRQITYLLYELKNKLISTINRRLPQPESGLLAGILFGKKDALDERTNEQFRKVGLMHIVVLSGYNVSLVITLIMRLLYFLPLRIRSLLAVVGIIAFALLVGAGPTVVRASIMALFVVLAENVGRKYSVQRGLIVAGVIMVLVNPWVLLFDISFQLSFLATYGLITFSEFFEHWLQWIPSFLELRASAVATLSAQVIVMPLLLYSIGDISIISPIVNVVVLFAIPWAMLLGFIVSFTFIPEIFSIIAYLPLRYSTWIVEHLSQVPYAVITIPPFHISIMLGMYIGIVVWYIYLKRNFSKNT